MENRQELKMGLKFVLASWPNANRFQKHGGRWFEETDLNMVFTCFYSICTFLLPSFLINLYLGSVFQL